MAVRLCQPLLHDNPCEYSIKVALYLYLLYLFAYIIPVFHEGGEITLTNDMVRKNLDKPLFLVGIRHNTKLHMYADTVTPYWDDEQMKLLVELENKYGKVSTPEGEIGRASCRERV